MKTIWIVRHAKAELAESGQVDFDRRLSTKGKQTAVVMGKKMATLVAKPDYFLSSPAKRAWSTAKRYASAFNMNKEEIKKEPAIYEARIETLLHLIRTLPENCQSAVLFGHNPGFTMLCQFLSSEFDTELPTCGSVCFEIHIDDWESVARNSGHIRFKLFPD